MGLTRWFRRRPSDDELREELDAHVAMRAEHDGVDDAAARRRLGNMLRTRERMRGIWVAGWWDELKQDARFTWRSWRRQPGFAVAAVLVLALGLGASTALFAALDRVLFRPLPYAQPDRLVSVGLRLTPPNGSAVPDFLQIETMTDVAYVQVWDTTPAPFEAVTVVDTATCDIAEEGPEGVRCGRVEHNFLRVLGLSVVAGRDFAPDDDVRGAPPVALISHGLWVRRYGADPRVIGRRVSLESGNQPVQQVPIIGVLPPEFEMPVEAADILLPFRLRPLDPDQAFSTFIMALARLKPDVTPERAALMLAPQLPEMMEHMPPQLRGAWSVRPLRERRFGDAAQAAGLLAGAVALFLLIACVNVTNLTLARVAERQREFAVRAAVGAGKARLARLALADSVLLALAAGSIGLLVAFALLRVFVAMAPPGLPGVADASIDVRVFAVAVPLVVITGIAIGLWPAVSVFRAGGLEGLRATSAAVPGARPRARFALVTTQIALTLALVGGSTLLLRSLWNVVHVPLGFDAENVVTLTAGLSATRYPTDAHGSAFFEELLARARATAGAVSGAWSDAPPPPRPPRRGVSSIRVEGRPADPDLRHPTIGIREVTPQYFETFRIPPSKGRTFLEADSNGQPAVVLNQSARRILFGGERAVGRRIQPVASSGPWSSWYTVVGVVPDIRNSERVTDAPDPEIYVMARRGAWGRIGRVSLRTAAGPADAATFLRQIAADLDPRQLVTIQTGEELFTTVTAQPRFIAWLLSAFAALALLLAAAGLYSMASYLVTQRRRDIGVRIAIGAAPGDVARQVVGEAARWIVGGAVLGCALGWMGTRALQSQLYEVTALDPWSWAAALFTLAVTLAMAVARPAYRAAHVDPIAALRAD